MKRPSIHVPRSSARRVVHSASRITLLLLLMVFLLLPPDPHTCVLAEIREESDAEGEVVEEYSSHPPTVPTQSEEVQPVDDADKNQASYQDYHLEAEVRNNDSTVQKPESEPQHRDDPRAESIRINQQFDPSDEIDRKTGDDSVVGTETLSNPVETQESQSDEMGPAATAPGASNRVRSTVPRSKLAEEGDAVSGAANATSERESGPAGYNSPSTTTAAPSIEPEHAPTTPIEDLYDAAESIKQSIHGAAVKQTEHVSGQRGEGQNEDTEEVRSDEERETQKEDDHGADADINFEYGDDEYDDRTLLDVFAFAAKEWLTHKAIPDTDLDCKWDWRALKCEPSCQCVFKFKKGDYHLGRSCRRRIKELEVCEPTVNIVDKPVPKRILSLVRQTVDILKTKVKRGFQKTTNRFTSTQENVCADLRTMLSERPKGACWSSPPVLTLPERIFCRDIEFPVCDGNNDDTKPTNAINAATSAPIAVRAAVGARKKDQQRKSRTFGDMMYETDQF